MENAQISERDSMQATVLVTYTLPAYADMNGLQFGWASGLFNGSYAWEEHESVRGLVDRTRGERCFLVKRFNKEITTSAEVLAWADANGYRAATHEEAVDFAKAHPDLQRQFRVVALGSFTLFQGDRNVAVLNGREARRGLSTREFDAEWTAGHCFLLVRK